MHHSKGAKVARPKLVAFVQSNQIRLNLQSKRLRPSQLYFEIFFCKKKRDLFSRKLTRGKCLYYTLCIKMIHTVGYTARLRSRLYSWKWTFSLSTKVISVIKQEKACHRVVKNIKVKNFQLKMGQANGKCRIIFEINPPQTIDQGQTVLRKIGSILGRVLPIQNELTREH